MIVTTCVVVWIEICFQILYIWSSHVTTCVVVWIEIRYQLSGPRAVWVTTCVVVWIEIIARRITKTVAVGHHLRGGVD